MFQHYGNLSKEILPGSLTRPITGLSYGLIRWQVARVLQGLLAVSDKLSDQQGGNLILGRINSSFSTTLWKTFSPNGNNRYRINFKLLLLSVEQ